MLFVDVQDSKESEELDEILPSFLDDSLEVFKKLTIVFVYLKQI